MRKTIFAISTIICAVGFFTSEAVLLCLLDDPVEYFPYSQKEALAYGIFFPSLCVSYILFRIMLKKYHSLTLEILPFVIPLITELSVDCFYRYGNPSHEYLPKNSYRHFVETPAFSLIMNIVNDKSITNKTAEFINYQEPNSGLTPLLFCIENHYYEKGIELLNMGANPNLFNPEKKISPLSELCKKYYSDTINFCNKKLFFKTLLEKGAIVNCHHYKESPLTLLCDQSGTEVSLVKLLFEYKQRNDSLNIVYQSSYKNLNIPFSEEIKGACMTSIFYGNYSCALFLINQGADISDEKVWVHKTINNNRKKRNPKEALYEQKLLNLCDAPQ